MDLQGTDIHRAAIQTEGPLRVHLQQQLRQPVVVEALSRAARDIAEQLTRLLQGQRDAGLAEQRPQPPHVAEHVAAARNPVEEAEHPA